MSEDYAALEVRTWDSPDGNVRVHWVEEGPAAPDLTTSPPNAAPDFVVSAGEVLEAALAAYGSAGYRAPLRDAGPNACDDDGGDARIDIYLVDFGGGDGQVVAEPCISEGGIVACAGFVLLEAQPTSYPSDDIALRTIVPHELFHLVQNAYTAEVPPWFSEGSAQWAANGLDPALEDLEHFLPAFFAEAERSIDSPPGGAAGAFLYGAAIWPVFLEHRFGNAVARDLLEGMGNGATIWEATDGALAAHDTTVAAEYPLFVAFNAATGERAGRNGYAAAATYPMVDLRDTTPAIGELASDVLAGFGSRYYRVASGDQRLELELDGDADRISGRVVPLVDGRARLDQIATLPAELPSDAVVIVSGTTPSKVDAPFVLVAREIEGDGGAGGEGGAGEDGAGAASGGEDGATEDGCSCTVAASNRRPTDRAWLASGVVAGIATALRSRGRTPFSVACA